MVTRPQRAGSACSRTHLQESIRMNRGAQTSSSSDTFTGCCGHADRTVMAASTAALGARLPRKTLRRSGSIAFTGILLASLALGPAYAGTVSKAEASLFQVQLRLAQSGDPSGEFYVGEMYQQGLGTPRNLEQAHKWYERSARKGNLEAKEKLANWSKLLQAVEQAKLQKQAAARAAILAKRQAVARAAAMAKEQAAARARAKEIAQAEALARERAAAQRARQRAADEAAARRLQRERAAALRARLLAQEKTRAAAEARQRAAAIAIAKTRRPVVAKLPDRESRVAESAPPRKVKHHALQFSPDPCKGPAAKFLSTCQ